MAVKLTDLISHNRWWRGEGWEMNDQDLKRIKRRINRDLIKIPEGKLTVFRGIRRSGKTVYLKSLISDLIQKGQDPRSILYLSCDRIKKSQIKNIVEEFIIRRGGGYLFLDEITYMDGWELMLKELMEEGQFTIIATGSNPLGLKKKIDRLPGRGLEGNDYYFNPLSFREFVLSLLEVEDRDMGKPVEDALQAISVLKTSFKPDKADISDLIPYYEEIERLFRLYLFTGGFPDAISDLIEMGHVSSETYETIIRVILDTIAKEGKSEGIARAIMEKLLAIGPNRIDFRSLGSDIELHHNTVHDYLELLEDSRITFLLHPWDISKGRHFPRKQKKVIFQSSLLPTALYAYLRGVDWDGCQRFVDRNVEWIVEDVVATHLIWTLERPLMMEKHAFAGYYYGKKECDMVIFKDDCFMGFETKYGKLKRAKLPFQTIYLTKDEIDDDAIPVSLFLFGLEKSKRCL